VASRTPCSRRTLRAYSTRGTGQSDGGVKMVFTAKVSNPACGGAGAGDERVKRGRKERRERTGRRIVGRAG
jgi:hypothetical protein